MVLQIEFEFKLPLGYMDREGELHREGVMRLATAGDEILPLKDSRVQSNPNYLSFILLSRVVTRLGKLQKVEVSVIEGLFVKDFEFLQEFYRRINGGEGLTLSTKCPHCGEKVEVSFGPGES